MSCSCTTRSMDFRETRLIRWFHSRRELQVTSHSARPSWGPAAAQLHPRADLLLDRTNRGIVGHARSPALHGGYGASGDRRRHLAVMVCCCGLFWSQPFAATFAVRLGAAAPTPSPTVRPLPPRRRLLA